MMINNPLYILTALALWIVLSLIVLTIREIWGMLRQPPPRIRLVDQYGNEIPLEDDDTGPLHYDEIDQYVEDFYRELKEAAQQDENQPSDTVLTRF